MPIILLILGYYVVKFLYAVLLFFLRGLLILSLLAATAVLYACRRCTHRDAAS
jgi:hypothetical protein